MQQEIVSIRCDHKKKKMSGAFRQRLEGAGAGHDVWISHGRQLESHRLSQVYIFVCVFMLRCFASVTCLKHHYQAHPACYTLTWTFSVQGAATKSSQKYLEQLTWTFALSHTAPAQNLRKIPGCQFRSKGSFSFHLHPVLNFCHHYSSFSFPHVHFSVSSLSSFQPSLLSHVGGDILPTFCNVP